MPRFLTLDHRVSAVGRLLGVPRGSAILTPFRESSQYHLSLRSWGNPLKCPSQKAGLAHCDFSNFFLRQDMDAMDVWFFFL